MDLTQFLIVIGFVVGYIVLQGWVLPKMGVPTWMDMTQRRVPADEDPADGKHTP